MFIFKQSSISFDGNLAGLDFIVPPWTHACPILIALRMPNHGLIGTGGCNLVFVFLQYKIMTMDR